MIVGELPVKLELFTTTAQVECPRQGRCRWEE